jgi:ubiquinone/menaquinone biosynthesis C-methylase UbiE
VHLDQLKIVGRLWRFSAKPAPNPFHRNLRLGLALAFLAGVTVPTRSRAGSNSSPPRYEFRAVHDPDGIGKFYLGREIAQVMGHQGADWLERPEREAEEHTDEMIEQLHLQPGDVVADIGAGTGYLSRRLAKKVAPGGKVLAVDIQPEMLTLLTNKMAAIGITNVVPILGTVSEPRLPARSVDVVIMADVYHEFDFPYEMMTGICRALKPDGRVVFVEFRAEDRQVPIKPLHKMTETQVRKEMSALPLRWVGTSEVLPWQHLITFSAKSQP